MIRFCACCEERIFGPATDELCAECRADVEEADRWLAETANEPPPARVYSFDESEVPW